MIKSGRLIDHTRRPWWPKSPSEVTAVVRQLRESGRYDLFIFLVIAAAGGEWKIFKKAMEEACGMRPLDVRNLLARIDATQDWSLAYSTMQLPPELFTYFINVVRIGWIIRRESPEVGTSPRLRALVLKKAQLASRATLSSMSEELRAELIR